MRLTRHLQDIRRRQAMIEIAGDTFGCRLETDWNGVYRGVYPRFPVFHGMAMPHLKFGPARSWTWLLDLQTHVSPDGVVVATHKHMSTHMHNIAAAVFDGRGRRWRCVYRRCLFNALAPLLLHHRLRLFA